MPIQTIGSDRLYRKIARQLSELMAAGEFTAGQRLPAERELAEQLGVSRPSVREALIALEIEGKVEVRVGAGVFVTAPRPVAPPVAEEEGEGPFELLRARRLIEGEVTALAARQATEPEVMELRAAVDELQERERQGSSTEAPDRRFHTALGRATHNQVLAAVVQSLWDQGRGAVWKAMERHFQTPELRAATLRDHRAICDAIAAHDPRAARAAMHRHLDRVAAEFTRGWKPARRGRRPGAPDAGR